MAEVWQSSPLLLCWLLVLLLLAWWAVELARLLSRLPRQVLVAARWGASWLLLLLAPLMFCHVLACSGCLLQSLLLLAVAILILGNLACNLGDSK